MFKKILATIFLCFIVFSMCLISIADTTEDTDSEKKANPVDKLMIGLTNTVTGIVEIPRHIADSLKKKTPGAFVQEGIIDGMTAFVFRAFSGILDTVFFWMPPYDRPLVEPLI